MKYMYLKLNTGLLSSALLSMLLAVSGAQAQSRDDTPGYASGIEGNITRTGDGGCLRTGDWTADKATVVGCDDVVLDVDIEVVEGAPSGLVSAILIPAAAMFDFDKADLTEAGKQAIEENRKELRPELSEAYLGIIIGHTDSIGDPTYNEGLSLRRAEAVREYLVGTGVSADKLRVVGRGANDPIASNDTDEGRATNRRVEVIVVGEARALDAMLFPSVALFPRRSAELTEQGVKLIEENRELARELLSRASYVEIVGHTDDVGDDDYNQELSEQRAETVRKYLVESGADDSMIVTVGAGEKMPIATNSTPEGRAENRRVEVLVLGRVR
ncbi:MAG: OmpA family protein [Gammaproteobacteria bacterium]|nr:OmpA family protein [Gammaproteobacteria bacterium]